MQTLAFGMARDRAPDRARTLLVRDRGIWMWPGIALTRDYGNVVVPIGDENLRFWITRLHGPGALDTWFFWAIALAASCLTKNDETGAQRVLDGIGLNRFSADGREVMRKVAERFAIPELDLPTIAGPFLWSPYDVDAFMPFFDEWSEAETLLRKDWDEEKHPRWDEGAPEIKEIGRIMAQLAGETSEERLFRQIETAVRVTRWIQERGYDGLLETNLDPPKTLEELHEAVSIDRKDTQVHHIAEQTAARDEHFSEALIEGRDNLVRIPTLKHRAITGWFARPNPDYGWLSPRQYLVGKDWEERRRMGLYALRSFGVLK